MTVVVKTGGGVRMGVSGFGGVCGVLCVVVSSPGGGVMLVVGGAPHVI